MRCAKCHKEKYKFRREPEMVSQDWHKWFTLRDEVEHSVFVSGLAKNCLSCRDLAVFHYKVLCVLLIELRVVR